MGKAEYKNIPAYTSPLIEEEGASALSSGLIYMLPSDIALLHDPELLALVEEFASDAKGFADEFEGAWTKVMNADRFDGKC